MQHEQADSVSTLPFMMTMHQQALQGAVTIILIIIAMFFTIIISIIILIIITLIIVIITLIILIILVTILPLRAILPPNPKLLEIYKFFEPLFYEYVKGNIFGDLIKVEILYLTIFHLL